MRRRYLLRIVGLLIVAAIVGGGCWVETWRHHGDAVARWTIDGAAGPTTCARYGAERVEIRAIDAHGNLDSFVSTRCDAFTATVSLADGWYRLEITLIGTRGVAVSSSVTSGSFYVPPLGVVAVDVDFPVTAFGVIPLSAR